MRVEDIHDAICSALIKAGGTDCDSKIADASAVRADVFLQDTNTIIEVKSLTTDRNKTKAVREKSAEILQYSAMHEGGPIIFGDVAVPLSSLPRVTAEKLLMNLGLRVAKEIRIASKQIKATASKLGVQPRGLLIFGVPGHFDTHAGVIMTTAARVLTEHKHPAIHGVLVIAVPITGHSSHRPLSFSYHPRAQSEIPPAVIAAIGEAWFIHLQEIDGEPVTVFSGSEQDFMSVHIVDDDDWPSSKTD